MRQQTTNQLSLIVSTGAVCLAMAFGVKAQTLTHRYSFQDPVGSQTFADSIGGADWAGTLEDEGAGTANLTGSALVLDGEGDYAQLPAGITAGYTQVSIEVWADFSASNPFWTRVFSFGDETAGGAKNSGFDYCSYAGGNYQNLDYLSTNGADAYANNSQGLNGATNAHVTVVVDPVNNTMYYYNGTTVVSAEHNALFPLAQINDTFNFIGRSLYDTDPTLAGTIHEFRVYQGAITPAQVALNDVAGPANYLTSPGSITSLSLSTPVNPVTVRQTVQDVVTGNFTLVSNLNLVLYGGVTYTSGNTGIFTVSSSGVVTGVAVGTTTLVASYGGVSATNSITVVNPPVALTHRYSFNGNVNDSVGTANGTLMGDASVASGQLVLDGGGYLSLPAAAIDIATNAAVTIETWASIGATAEWSHIFEFGNVANHNFYCAPRADAGGFHEFGISEDGSIPGAQTLSWAHGWSNISLHITAVIDPTSTTMAVYTNGVLVQASYNAGASLTAVGTNSAALGQSSYGDPDAIANIDEFRIYNGALTPAQIAMSDASGPNTVNFTPGTLNSITVVATNYPAFSALVAPVILANYASLPNFNMVPNVYAIIPGLTVTSSDTNIVTVNPANMLTTHRPGTVTLTATYNGKTSSATVRVANQSVLAHRYSFNTDVNDSVGGANATLVGTANLASGQVQLDGGSGDYVSLPGGLLTPYRSATMDIWATITSAQQHWARLWEFADVGPATANEVYFAPAWNSGANATFLSDGVPFGGNNDGPVSPATVNETVHLTSVIGDGTMDLYTNGALYLSTGISAPASQAGGTGSWIGYSPYGDPGISGSVDEYRIYNGRLSPEEILASDVLGPNQTLSTSAKLTAKTSGGVTTLTWPVANAGFAVETATTLSSVTSWVTLTNAPSLVGTNWQLTLTNTGTAKFYQLIR